MALPDKAVNQHKRMAMGEKDIGFKKGGYTAGGKTGYNKGGKCYNKGGKAKGK